ncbi:metal ABC transporter solute-binding protein, Zn/Mn family [Robertkochia aurantiaca]|uniref:metal ABC transporter solute-binding protein, Zn/Mn family n=1 Tax=Robertkochia aurantiaca TaxID=2873700 RepID=UPI001CCEC36F|nr:zinc ABC transporter substrate-binding protein [Robertkochia sp. 3YJGBD-33]
MKTGSLAIIITSALLLMASCKTENGTGNKGKLQVVTTTTMLTDLLEVIGGDSINTQGLMGTGVDPHLYRASEGDMTKLYNADMVFYNGLHLEGKLVDVFEKMEQTNKYTVAVSDTLNRDSLIGSEYFASNYDPHIWFDVSYWKKIAVFTSRELERERPELAPFFRKNLEEYLRELDILDRELREKIEELDPEERILVTAHDAFNYFGRAFGFEVVGLQGLSTATEAGVKDVQELADFIIENDIKAIFVESSVPVRTIEALQEAVRGQGHEVAIGGMLYSDALGDKNTPEGTYLGMFRSNVQTIVEALKKDQYE